MENWGRAVNVCVGNLKTSQNNFCSPLRYLGSLCRVVAVEGSRFVRFADRYFNIGYVQLYLFRVFCRAQLVLSKLRYLSESHQVFNVATRCGPCLYKGLSL